MSRHALPQFSLSLATLQLESVDGVLQPFLLLDEFPQFGSFCTRLA